MERLVDVLDSSGAAIHTYTITLGRPGVVLDDAAYEAKAPEAAAHGRLVSDAEPGSLSARIHIGRDRQMAPYGDDVASSSETKSGLEQTVLERAYFVWEQDGRLAGPAEECWHRVLEQHLRDRAHVFRVQDGRPEGRADEYWQRICDFAAQ